MKDELLLDFAGDEEDPFLLEGEDEGLGGASFDPSSMEGEREVAAAIAVRLQQLHKPALMGGGGAGGRDIGHKGYLIMSSSKSAKWKQYWFEFSGTSLKYFRTPPSDSNTKPKGIIDIVFVSFGALTVLEKESMSQADFLLSSETRMRVFEAGRSRILTAKTQDETNDWSLAMKAMLEASFDEDVRQNNEGLAREIEALYVQQNKVNALKAAQLTKQLQRQGLGSGKDSTHVTKQGTLKMLNEQGDWQDHFLSIRKEYLYYSPVHHSHLESSTNLQNGVLEDDPEEEAGFVFKGPMVTYRFKAKHAIAKEQWKKAIEAAQTGKKIKRGDIGVDLEELAEEFRDVNMNYSNPRLKLCNSRGKQAKLKESKAYTIGRSSSCAVPVNDRTVSREHAKLVSIGHCKWVVLDLGSHSGTRVNGDRVIKHLLKPGDKIEVGNTELEFKAKALK